ncbi:MAG: diguanylate cyclase [Pleurocapsa sp. MO_192.B19]|nr:diguanylate cyclase [Pleurocapsa sp. MO_192.B19]
MMNRAFRKLHLRIAPILLIPLLATAITGILAGLVNRFGLPDILIDGLIMIHQGNFLGRKLVPFYVLLMGLGILALGLTTLINGRDNLIFRQTKSNIASIYKSLALILVFPLAVCVETGVAYRLGTDWLNMPREQTAIFLAIHSGAPLGTVLGILYIFITGLSLIALSIIGIEMTPFGKTASPENRSEQSLPVRRSSQSSLPSTLPLLDNVLLLKKKIRLAIIIFSVVFIAILAFVTSAIFPPIAIVGIVFTLPAWIIAEKLIQDWQQQKKTQVNFDDKEAESATILRAIPDSMLRITQDGICLSYIPAKEASSFVIRGEVVNRHVTEFLAPEIALQFIKSAQLSLRSGLTHFYRFPIPVDSGGLKYHEARISAIGATEVLIMIRELADFEEALVQPEPSLPSKDDDESVRLLDESELVQILELTRDNIQQDDQHHILWCLVVDNFEIDSDVVVDSVENSGSSASDFLISQVATQMKSYLSSDYIARLDKNELVVLVLNCSLDQASTLVDELRHNLNNFSFQWQGKEYPINVRIALVEINANSPDALGLIDVAKKYLEMAQQKVKTFW